MRLRSCCAELSRSSVPPGTWSKTEPISPGDIRDGIESDLQNFRSAYERPDSPLPVILRGYETTIASFVATYSGASEVRQNSNDPAAAAAGNLVDAIADAAEDPETSGAAVADAVVTAEPIVRSDPAEMTEVVVAGLTRAQVLEARGSVGAAVGRSRGQDRQGLPGIAVGGDAEGVPVGLGGLCDVVRNDQARQPASGAATIAAYLADLAEPPDDRLPLAMSTIQRRVASLGEAHKAAALANPCMDPLVKQVVKGIRRQLGVAPTNRKAGLSTADVRAMVTNLDLDRTIDVRDRAILLLGFATAMRRSELVALDVASSRNT